MHENVVVPVKKVILMDIRVILSWCLGENCSMDVGIPGDCSSQCLFEVMELGVNSTCKVNVFRRLAMEILLRHQVNILREVETLALHAFAEKFKVYKSSFIMRVSMLGYNQLKWRNLGNLRQDIHNISWTNN